MEYVLKILNYAPEIVALKILNAALSSEYYLDDGGPNMFVILMSRFSMKEDGLLEDRASSPEPVFGHFVQVVG
ncbi:unnamed protein product [Citrullus colocynthis]|uniref:Uncharacterized protein n=1 Tax=Citrullus colocynthis TaxID=252529 RepID=A0ABP0Y1Z5_9ROSI